MSDHLDDKWIQSKYDSFNDALWSKDFETALKIVQEVHGEGFFSYSEQWWEELYRARTLHAKRLGV